MTKEDYEKLKAHPKAYENLCNGMGPNGWKGEVIKAAIAGAVGKSIFRIAGDIHDLDYLMGGDEADMSIANTRFLENMADEILLEKEEDNNWAYVAAGAAWGVVEALGAEYFNFGPRRLSFEEVFEIGLRAKDEEDAKEMCIAAVYSQLN